MVPLLGLLNSLKVGVQLVLFGEGDAVDSLEGFPVGIPPPIGGVAGGELNGISLDTPCGIQVRTGAEVRELSLLVKADGGVLGKVVDQLHLKGFVLFLHELHGLCPGQLEALQLQLLLADLPHFALNVLHDLRREGKGRVHVVVEALVDGGADGQLHLRIQALDGLGQDVGAGVPIGFAVGLVLKGIQIAFFAHDKSSLY